MSQWFTFLSSFFIGLNAFVFLFGDEHILEHKHGNVIIVVFSLVQLHINLER